MKMTVILFLFLIPFGNLAPINRSLGDPPPKRKKYDGPRCQLKFSEVKLDWSLENEVSPFIELQSVCKKRPGNQPKNALSEYTMIIIQGPPLELAMVVSFEHFPHDGSVPFVVIGSPDVANVQISTATPHIQSVFSRTARNRMLPVPMDHSYSIILLRGLSKAEAKSLNLYFNPGGEMAARLLTTQQIKRISETAVDMVLLGDNEKFNTEQFEYFWPEISRPMYTETWRLLEAAENDMSLSMCSPVYEGFDASAFVLSQETPGEVNACEENNQIEDITTTENSENHEFITTISKQLHIITDEQLQQIRTHEFRHSWVDKCHRLFPKKSKMLENESIQKWIDFTEDECRFTCKACKSYLGIGFRPDIKAKSKIVTTGYLSTDTYDNGNAIRNHVTKTLHTEAMDFYGRMEQSVTHDEVTEIISYFEDKEKATFNATMNLLLIVYSEIMAGLPFQAHEALMKAIRKTGANVGTKHHTDDAPSIIAKVLANTFRQKLLHHLITEEQPFSIIIDSSTSFNIPFLAVYIQVLEDKYPITHFYSLIHMAEGETAAEMSNYFVKQIKKDDELVIGFEKYFKSNIVSFSSDGAAVMIGSKKSFKTHLHEYVGRDVPNVVCLAHKLDSAYKYGIKPAKHVLEELDDDDPIDEIRKWQFSFFETFEQTLNELYTFYSSRGYKKWMHFLQTSEELEINAKRMKYIWNVRWSESHFKALETIHQMLYGILEDLDRIRKDGRFDDTSRRNADEHYNRMTDKTYLIVLHEFLDILSSFKIASKKLQESSATLVGKGKLIYGILDEMEDLHNNQGSSIKGFLQNIACPDICDDGDCTLNNYDACEEVLINGFQLTNRFEVVMDYTEVRDGLYRNIIVSLKKYFSLDLLESFELFNPINLNFKIQLDEFEEHNLDTFYLADPRTEKYYAAQSNEVRIKFLCQFYSVNKANCDQFKTEWVGVLSCLATTEGSALDNSADSTRFWPLALTLCADQWTPLTKEILGYVMVTPFTSSEVERGFSIMNNLKTKGRSRMDKGTLDALMTVKINGPDIERFNVYEYTIAFLKSHARVDDDTMNRGRKPAEETFSSLFSKSRIYE